MLNTEQVTWILAVTVLNIGSTLYFLIVYNSPSHTNDIVTYALFTLVFQVSMSLLSISFNEVYGLITIVHFIVSFIQAAFHFFIIATRGTRGDRKIPENDSFSSQLEEPLLQKNEFPQIYVNKKMSQSCSACREITLDRCESCWRCQDCAVKMCTQCQRCYACVTFEKKRKICDTCLKS